MATDPVPFNLPVDKVLLVLDLVASWQIDQILAAPLLPRFDPRSNEYVYRNQFRDDPADFPDPYGEEDEYDEHGWRYKPGMIYNQEIWCGNGDRGNPAFAAGYGEYRHKWEMEMVRDLGQWGNRRIPTFRQYLRQQIPAISEIRAPYTEYIPFGFGHRFQRFYSKDHHSRPTLAVSTCCNPHACLLSLGQKLECKQVESCLKSDWPGDRDWEVMRRESKLSEKEALQRVQERWQKGWGFWGDWYRNIKAEEQYRIKMQALKFMQQVNADVESNMKEGNGEGVEYLALYGNRRLVEPQVLYGRKRKGVGLWVRKGWRHVQKVIGGLTGRSVR